MKRCRLTSPDAELLPRAHHSCKPVRRRSSSQSENTVVHSVRPDHLRFSWSLSVQRDFTRFTSTSLLHDVSKRRRGGRQPASGQGGEESTIPEGDEASEGGTKKLHSKNRYRNRGSKPADGKEVPDGERSGPRPRNARRGNRQRCFNCGKSGHQTRECELPPGNTNCYTCLQPGHKSSECPNGKPAEMAA